MWENKLKIRLVFHDIQLFMSIYTQVEAQNGAKWHKATALQRQWIKREQAEKYMDTPQMNRVEWEEWKRMKKKSYPFFFFFFIF